MSHVQPSCLPLTGSPSDSPPLPELRVRLLGSPHITLGDVPLSFKRRKAVALLAYLAMTGRAHTREALASLLSGETDEDDQAKSHLRNTLYALCGQVGDYLLLTRETITLNPARPYWLDAQALHTALMAARDPAADTEALARSIDLYEGEFLAGFTVRDAPEFEEWLLQERHRLHGLIVQAIELLLARASEHGDDAGMLSWARRLLEVEPWHEDAHRQLMRVLARTGQRATALVQYETCCRVLATELGQTPQPETQALYDQLCAAPVAPSHNLTVPTPACVGRDQDLAALLHRLEDPSCRLITLLGMGGSGKTCLALRAAAHYVNTPALLDEHPFADGIYQIRLAGARTRAGRGTDASPQMARRLVVAIGRALGLDVCAVSDPTAQLLAWLRPKKLLLVIENGERLQAGVAVLRTIVQQAPGVTLLVTSRERLQVPEEWVAELDGLALPSDASQIEQAGASQLFLQQAQQVGMDGQLSADDRAHIVQICQATQGLPLALVLAARWRRGLSCGAIAAELAQGIDLLATTDRGVPERHRSIRAVLAASWERLTVEVQAVLRRLAVCEGGFTQEAAHAIAGAELSQVLALRDRVLLSYDEQGRYVSHELVRRYAAEQMASRPEEERKVRARHAAYYAGFVKQHADALYQTPQARDAITREIANVRTAWAWAVTHKDVHLLSQMRQGLVAWYELAGEYREWSHIMGWAAGEVRTALSVAGTDGQSLLCALLVDEARGWIEQGQYDRALASLQEASALAQASQLLHLETYAACYHGQLLYRQGLTGAAQQQLEQALALARTAGAQDLEAWSLWYLGRLAVALAEYPQARDYCAQALSLYHALGDQMGEAAVRCELGTMAYEQGRFAAACTYFKVSADVFRMLGYRAGERCALHGLGLVFDGGLGDHSEAADYVARELDLAQEIGDRQGESQALASQGRHALLQGDLGRARSAFAQALSISQGLGNQDTASVALRGLGLVAHYTGDARHACDYAQQAVRIAQESRQRRSEHFALRLLGHALVGLDQITQATVVYQRALELDRKLGYEHLGVEITSDLARVALMQGDEERAVAYVTRILDHLMEQGAAGTEEAVLLYLTCYRVLRTRHDPRAEEVLAAGYSLLQGRADQFADIEQRTRFLESLPAHRDLLRLWQQCSHRGRVVPVLIRGQDLGVEAWTRGEVAPVG